MKLRNRIAVVTVSVGLLFGGTALPAHAGAGSVPAVDEYHQAAPGMYQPGGDAGLDVPNLYIHQFNAHRADVHIDSVINAFTAENSDRIASADFAVEGERVAQFMGLTDMAYAQGPGNPDGVSVETYGPQDEATKQNTAQLIYELEVGKGSRFNLMTHNEVMATACGEGVDLADYRARVDALHNPPAPDHSKPVVDLPKSFYVRAA